MGKTGNILDPVNRSNNWFVAQYRLGGEELNKQIRLDKVSFTLDDFDKLCSGTYNAGSLTLGKSGRLDIVNNHVGFLSLILNGNNVKAADSFAIRSAFANALESAGLSDEQMAEVRERLGLRRDNNTYNGGLCFTALKRQEVREIIDTYVDELNANRDADHQLRTQAQRRKAEHYDSQQVKYLDRVRKSVNGCQSANTKIEFDTDLLHALDFMSTSDYSDKKIYSNDKLYEMSVFFEDLEDRVDELIHTDEDDMAIWRHENPGEERFLPVSATLSVGVDSKTGKVLLKSQGIGESKVFVFSSGFTPQRLQEIIQDGNRRLHAEGKRRGLALAGSEDMDPDDNSIREVPKFKRDIIDEPIGGKTIIETDDIKPKSKIDIIDTRDVKPKSKASIIETRNVKPKNKYNFIEEREDKPKSSVKRRPRPIIDLNPEDDDDSDVEFF